MRKTVAAIESGSTKVPAQIATPLTASWNSYGAKLADYRNYVAHTGALSSSGVCWMSRFERQMGCIGCTVGKPRGQEAGAHKIPNVGLDALAYCHDVATHLVELCEEMTALPEIADYLAHPPGYGDRPKAKSRDVQVR